MTLRTGTESTTRIGVALYAVESDLSVAIAEGPLPISRWGSVPGIEASTQHCPISFLPRVPLVTAAVAAAATSFIPFRRRLLSGDLVGRRRRRSDPICSGVPPLAARERSQRRAGAFVYVCPTLNFLRHPRRPPRQAAPMAPLSKLPFANRPSQVR